jgi:hypothetical protein
MKKVIDETHYCMWLCMLMEMSMINKTILRIKFNQAKKIGFKLLKISLG